MVRSDHGSILRPFLPKTADHACQEAQRTPRLLKVGNGRDFPVEHREEFRVKRVICHHFFVEIGSKHPLGNLRFPFRKFTVVRPIGVGRLDGSRLVERLEEPVSHDGCDFGLISGRDDSFVTGSNLPRLHNVDEVAGFGTESV